jgi:nucleotidyltransferase substrate binding protein (TIGR01987 family)
MIIDTSYLEKCINALEKAYENLIKFDNQDLEYEIYRSAVIKEFEIILEQSGKLLKKILKPYFHSPKAVDKLYFKDIFREAGIHSLLNIEEVERWLIYRDNRNNTAHDYGEDLANSTLPLIKEFIADSRNLVKVIKNANQR